jgi:hypothetical protein
MLKQPASAPLSVEQLLEAVKHLPRAELREFQRQFTAWQDQNARRATDEAELVQAARARLPATDERRLKRLIAKSEQGTLTPKELAEYRSLALQAQQLDTTRLEALAELARRWGKPVRVIMEEIGWEGANGP